MKMLLKNNNKHAFLSEATSPHTINLILNLIYKDILKKSDILLILYHENKSKQSIENTCRAHKIDVLTWSEAKNLNLSFLTLNPLSLLSLNSEIIAHCIRENYVKSSHVNILMQDDELDRWFKLYNEVGSLQVNSSALIDENVLSILQIVDNYIIPYNVLGERLEIIVGRKLNIIDAVLPFNVLDYKSQNFLEDFVNTRKQYIDDSYIKVLMFTKPFSMKVSFYGIVSYLTKNKRASSDKKIILGVWFNNNLKGLILSKIISLIIRVIKSPIKIVFHTPTSHGQYFLMLHEYDSLILQGRGGFSTAKYFAEKVGKLITLTDTPNDLILKQSYGINTFNYENLSSALNAAIENSKIDEAKELSVFANALRKRHDKSFEVLKEFWKCF